MNARHTALAVGMALMVGSAALAQPKAGPSDDERVAQAQQLLEQTEIDPKPLAKKNSTLAEFLAALQTSLPADKRLTFRLDAEALGKDLAKISGAAVQLERCTGDDKLQVVQLLRYALGGVKDSSGVELDYGVRSNEVVVSFPRFAIFRIEYDLPARFGRADATQSELRDLGRIIWTSHPPEDSPVGFSEMLTTTIPLRTGETVELVNGTRLIVTAAGDRHEQFRDLLDQCGRLLDLAVVMSARLYEVDLAFFEKNVAPLFSGRDPAPVVRLDGPTFQKFVNLKPLTVSDGVRLRRGEDSVFLARQLPFRTPAGNGVEGVSFTVDPSFSADRRFVRLKITQKSAQVVGVKTIPMRGDSPDVRLTTTLGVVQIPDSEPILMRVDYRPAVDKAWVMVARPLIWIDREMRERYVGEPQDIPRVDTPAEYDRLLKARGVTIASIAASCWDAKVGAEEPSSSGADTPPMNDTMKEIMQAVVRDTLTNPKLARIRNFYGTPGEKTVVLESGEGKGWPPSFAPQTFGYKIVKSKPEPFSRRPRVLRLRLSRLDMGLLESGLSDEPIEVQFYNAGGGGIGAVSGGTLLSYSLRRVEQKWVVRLSNINDP
jgi:hypothetical protein